MTFPTRAQLFQTGVTVAVTRGALRPPSERLTADAINTPGSDANIVNAQASFMADAVSAAAAQGLADLYLDSAEGPALDRLVADRFSPTVVRKDATPAVVTLTLARAVPLVSTPVTVPAGTLFQAFGVQFALSTAATLSGFATLTTVVAQAVQSGQSGNVGAGTITQPVSPLPSPALTAGNTEPAAGGSDTETDSSLRARARDFFRTARRGTLQAIAFGALTVGGVAAATAVEELDAMGLPTGVVSVYIADSNGQGNAALAAAVVQALLEYRAAGIVVQVIASVPYMQPIELHLGTVAGYDTRAVFAAVQQAVVAAVNSLRPNQTLERSLLFSVCRSVQGVIVGADAIVVPATDVVPIGTQIIRTSASIVTSV